MRDKELNDVFPSLIPDSNIKSMSMFVKSSNLTFVIFNTAIRAKHGTQ